MNTAMSVIWMSQNADDAPEAAGSLMVAAIQTSILLDSFSVQATFIGSAVLAAAAAALIGSGQKLPSGVTPTWREI